jgi:hypothetical protein
MAMSAKLDRRRLVKVLGMLGSRHDGEALNAARTAHTMLAQAKTRWEELLGVKPGEEPEPLPQEDAAPAAKHKGKFTDPDYPDMLKVVLKSKGLDGKSRKRFEEMEDRLCRGLSLSLDDKLLVRWLYHTSSGKS